MPNPSMERSGATRRTRRGVLIVLSNTAGYCGDMNTHHRINYLEFKAHDLDAVKAFYLTVFGWQFTDYGPDYTAFTDGNLEGGFERGVVKGTEGVLVIVYSSNLEKSLGEITKAGGSITKEPYAFPGGRRFHFLDPAGNELAVWSDV